MTRAAGLCWLLAGLLGLAPWTPLWAQTPAGETCQVCHRQQLEGGRAHGALAHSCTACHGASEAHVRAPTQTPPTIRFGAADTGDAGTNACLACHRGNAAAHWAFSEHAGSGVGCVACHTLHSGVDPVQQDVQEFQVCTGCHQRQRAEQMQFSRHPLQEGHVQCSHCHAPHGGAAMNGLTEASINEVCYQCHAAKRGPFLFEHEPVQEDCGHCHLPHASIHDHLLVAREPMLCQRCHVASRHPSRVYDTTQLVMRDINMIGQSCTNCHSQVHGGNQPQSATFRR